MLVSAIMAVGHNGEIGRNGTTPWAMPWPRMWADMKWFRNSTVGKPVIMGRVTWETLSSRPLLERGNIVLSRTLGTPRGATVVRSPGEALAAAADLAGDAGEVVVIGGKQVYEAFWPRVEKVYLTKVDGEFPDADVRVDYPFPQHDHRWVEREVALLPGSKPYRLGFYVVERRPWGTPPQQGERG